eukprot:6190700-Pleurochrysis_carterae.AAC.1
MLRCEASPAASRGALATPRANRRARGKMREPLRSNEYRCTIRNGFYIRATQRGSRSRRGSRQELRAQWVLSCSNAPVAL